MRENARSVGFAYYSGEILSNSAPLPPKDKLFRRATIFVFFHQALGASCLQFMRSFPSLLGAFCAVLGELRNEVNLRFRMPM
jgi:hypothetical protein